MQPCGTTLRNLTAAALTPLAFIAPAVGAPIEELLGTWTALDFKECANDQESKDAPLLVARDNEETRVGSDGWQCSVKNWATDGILLKGDATCSSEGGGEADENTIRLGLTSGDKLVLIYNNDIALYSR